MGTVHETVSGRQCQAWTSNIPHVPSVFSDDQFPDGSREAASNYCRNPDDEPFGPWCYTMDPNTRWEYCDVSLCRKSVCCGMLGLHTAHTRGSKSFGYT